MKYRWFKAVMSLPVTVVVLIPAGLLFIFSSGKWSMSPVEPSNPVFWFGVACSIIGLLFGGWSLMSFGRFGAGTPAPWDPPTRFVIFGPYRYVRNPMILGVILVLLAEASLLKSVPVFGWFCTFVIGNALYIPFIEEKGLERRFGETYIEFKKNVPRWLPRLTAWRPDVKA